LFSVGFPFVNREAPHPVPFVNFPFRKITFSMFPHQFESAHRVHTHTHTHASKGKSKDEAKAFSKGIFQKGANEMPVNVNVNVNTRAAFQCFGAADGEEEGDAEGDGEGEGLLAGFAAT
jgi:hypothetical protein